MDELLDTDTDDLYEHAPCGYISTRPDGTIVRANQTFLGWTGLDRHSTIGCLRWQDLLAPGDRIFYETHYAPMLSMQGRVREVAVELVLADRTRLPVLANSVLTRDAAGNPRLVRTVLFDARERRAYERELLEARRRAEEAEARAMRLARTLQATFLPPVTPRIPGLDVAGAYRPAGDGREVGGDFYDVFETARGSHAVILGDVSGKGPDAAVVTALVRHIVRAEMLRSPSPADVLALVHEAIRRDDTDRFCTALLLEVVVDDDEVAVTVVSAGHELPILAAGGATTRVGRAGSLLGIVDDMALHDIVVDLPAGASLVLYTDGVSEARGAAGFFGDDRVESVVAAHAHASAAEIADAVVRAALEFQASDPHDDIAVLVLKRP